MAKGIVRDAWKNLKSKEVFRFFEEICAIPHGSGNVKNISNYLADFAREKRLWFRRDAFDNVIIKKPGTAGYEDSPTVMLQGHMDMVCEKAPGCNKDMRTEGLDLFVDGDFLGAEETTLGADDGFAVAVMLAILDSEEISHAPLECVFTTDEETGMDGAIGLDASDLKAKYLLNLDSEEEGTFVVSCAGSAHVTVRFSGNRTPFAGDTLELHLGGLLGGHSGEKIGEGRGNANLLVGRALYRIGCCTELRLIDMTGGSKDNAIPREAVAHIAVASRFAAETAVEELLADLKKEYRWKEPNLFLTVGEYQTEKIPFDADATARIVRFLYAVPNGVQSMSADLKGFVLTPGSFGLVWEEDGEVVCSLMPRSGINSQRDEMIDKVKILGEALGGVVEVPSTTPAWEYNPQSNLRAVIAKVYGQTYGTAPRFEPIHGGVECGLLSEKIPGLDAVCMGPDILDIHTPGERLSISSAERVWNFLLNLLKELK